MHGWNKCCATTSAWTKPGEGKFKLFWLQEKPLERHPMFASTAFRELLTLNVGGRRPYAQPFYWAGFVASQQ
jgi:hypothetical protein